MGRKEEDTAVRQFIRLQNLARFLTDQGNSGATLEEIQEKVYMEIPSSKKETEAFKKKFYRDRKDLEEMYNENLYFSEDDDETDESRETDESDVKIVKQKGRYYIKSRYTFMFPMTIREEELLALVAGVKLAGHFIKPLESFAESLWNKLKKQFPDSQMEKGERLSRAISFAMPVSDMKSDREVFKKAVGAIDEKKVLYVRQYENRYGEKKPYKISPYALFFKYHAWYLMGISLEQNESSPVVFRLNRMKMPEVLSSEKFIDCPYSPEELQKNIELDFDPYNPDKEHLIKLRITGSFARAAMETKLYSGEKKEVEHGSDGEFSVQYEVKLKGLERITLWIMRALDCIEILEPQELKDEIDKRVNAYLEHNRRAVHET